MANLSIENLRKQFEDGSIIAVDDLSLEIQDGEFLVIVGPSGCGKTTTLNCIAGLEIPDSGQITLGDNEITDLKPQNRDIAMVFQNYALYPHKSVRDNIGFGLKMKGEISGDKINEKVENVAKMMDIDELLDQKPKELSGGQRQRVALGRAIVREPEIFLLDEPLSNLDAKLRTKMRTELQELQEELGITSVYVTHDQTEAMTMADKIAIMNDGNLQQFGTPLECYHNPTNKFVAGFLGSPSMNFFDVTYEAGLLQNKSFSCEIGENAKLSTDDLTIGIRPEHIELPDDGAGDIKASVQVVEPMGDETVLYAKIGDQPCTVKHQGGARFETGETVGLVFPKEKIHFFNTEGDSLQRTPESVIA